MDNARQELANLDKKARDQKVKVKALEDEIARAEIELENLPPPPQGIEEKKQRLSAQWKDLNMQVRNVHVTSCCC